MNSVRPGREEELHFSSTLTYVILIGWSWRHQVMPTFPTLLSRRNTESIISALKFYTPLHINNKVGFRLLYKLHCLRTCYFKCYKIVSLYFLEGIWYSGWKMSFSFKSHNNQEMYVFGWASTASDNIVLLRHNEKMFVRVWVITIGTTRLGLFERDNAHRLFGAESWSSSLVGKIA